VGGSWLTEVDLWIDYTGKQQVTVRINGFSGFTANCLVDPLDPAVSAGKIGVYDRSVWMCDLGVLDDEVEHLAHMLAE
jgi:hypothetical protein